MDFYIYLPSNTGDFVDNTISRFRVKLPHLIDLEGDWEVALVEIAYPITWFNVSSEKEGQITIWFNDYEIEVKSKCIPYNNYTTIDELCDAINYTLDTMRSFDGKRVNFNFVYDNIRHRVGLRPISDVKEPNLQYIRLSTRLQYMLGFKEEGINLMEGSMEVLVDGDIRSKRFPLEKVNWSAERGDQDKQTIDFFNDMIKQLTDGRDCKIEYVPARGDVTFEVMEHGVGYLKFSENVQYRLGLGDNKIYPNRKYRVKQPAFMKSPNYYAMAEGAPDIKAAQYSLFVYCDLVRPQIVGNALAPILRAVSIRGKYGEIVDELYDNPHYVPVLKREFASIEININDDAGRLVNFQYGKLFVKLHFRPKP